MKPEEGFRIMLTKLNNKIKVGLIGALLATMAPLTGTISPAQAATANVGRLWASCSMFSVDVAVNGSADDGGGQDRFRYFVFDGTNKKLYQEDAIRPIGQTISSIVVNMSYDADGVDGQPVQNPITFQVLDLNNANAVIGVLSQLKVDAKCLPASGMATFSSDFRPPFFNKARVIADTPLFQSPGGGLVGDLRVTVGKEQFAIYRSFDAQWVQIDVGGNELVWVPAASLQVDLTRLNTPPQRIDLNDPSKVSGVVVQTPVPGTPPVVVTPFAPLPGAITSASTTSNLRLRATASSRGRILRTIPIDSALSVFGRNSRGSFIKVGYDGLIGWVSTCCVIVIGRNVRDLPVVP
jgi:hypothetical protein